MTNLTTTESGLEINITHLGEGETPKIGDTVLMHYELWISEGASSSLYDYDEAKYVDSIHYSTKDPSLPISGPIEIIIGKQTPKDEIYSKGDSIYGLDEALLNIKEGGSCELLIPPDLAYGEEGASSFHTFHGYRSPPNQAIRCNIELVEIRRGDKNG
tara:strand:+ start:198 stop:671 length:474 start_codon:yes stop_codon:yes gene_type:complete